MSDKFNGIIEKIFVKYNDKAKRNSVSIINNGNFYGLGLHNDKFVKVGDVVLKEGMQVEFEYAGQFKNIDMTTFKIVQQEVPKEVKKARKDDDLPMRFGNAINVATFLTKSKSDIIGIAKQILPMIDDLRDKLAIKYPSMTEKGIGSRCGQCVLIAAQYTANINDFIDFAEELFEEICRAEEELKNPKKVKKEETNSAQNNLTQSPHNVATPVYNEPSVDWDEDIPF
ncbi:hypothetical protein HWC26_gp072 [Aeromonas phage 2L372X]|uniref:Uncharacterized protein n=2 Tax=Plateaulakevirus TaxID=2843436 RepID=A0A5B9N3B2_9CAUD|nr:hypothetical protein HWC26_gp072 [Aeromonas phage 2L372X]YP_009846875.1 hypothetical protein HWC28_gp076 [Aeromonas phage 4L372XY]QEG08324.1 hypothetical protein [Aeromonas phage 2L372X]QEG08791.1 hypothetical protein [Aeromonas phage 4L372XY]